MRVGAGRKRWAKVRCVHAKKKLWNIKEEGQGGMAVGGKSETWVTYGMKKKIIVKEYDEGRV